MNRLQRRHLVSRAAMLICLGLAVLASLPLFSLLWELFQRGHGALNMEFFTTAFVPAFVPGGGILHAIVGSLLVVGLGTAMGAPVGIMCGIYLSEYQNHRAASTVRTVVDAMTGIPSIVAGLVGYAVVVRFWGFSAYAGGFALAILVIPVVARTTEEALRLVPRHLREASLALGSPQWKTILKVVLPASWTTITTGLLLSVARITGETAPLLLTTLTSSFVVTNPGQPVQTLPGLIYNYGKSAYPKLQEQAWGAALVLIVAILVLNIVVRVLSRRQHRLD